MPAPRAERATLSGPQGPLEALIETPAEGPPRAVGVVCHPHPLYGGNMDHKVVHTVARAFGERGAASIRFNFRGVGASAGAYDEGRGETRDALAVIEYARGRWPGLPLWLGGFSFGGAVAVLAAATSHPDLLVLISPGVTKIDVTHAPGPACPWLIVQGDADDVVPADFVLDWARTLTPAPTLALLAGAGHFFHGRITDLKDAVLRFIPS
ncbi:MAG: alpha/beta hydrolase [Proteobacteria bacterium]|nr:alpha/beta hydrolase [Pseudomonadota bacterium]